jgi:hypothetical protein
MREERGDEFWMRREQWCYVGSCEDVSQCNFCVAFNALGDFPVKGGKGHIPGCAGALVLFPPAFCACA